TQSFRVVTYHSTLWACEPQMFQMGYLYRREINSALLFFPKKTSSNTLTAHIQVSKKVFMSRYCKVPPIFC
uniref:Uncharacterized protein n=1 Tax=Parascaris univalens TaxID=6257 RepID=A0A914ZZP8_PARUN